MLLPKILDFTFTNAPIFCSQNALIILNRVNIGGLLHSIGLVCGVLGRINMYNKLKLPEVKLLMINACID